MAGPRRPHSSRGAVGAQASPYENYSRIEGANGATGRGGPTAGLRDTASLRELCRNEGTAQAQAPAGRASDAVGLQAMVAREPQACLTRAASGDGHAKPALIGRRYARRLESGG